ncbi:hypothetical protein BH11PSE2_BH11PSE2_15060 [soil metagenome]
MFSISFRRLHAVLAATVLLTVCAPAIVQAQPAPAPVASKPHPTGQRLTLMLLFSDAGPAPKILVILLAAAGLGAVGFFVTGASKAGGARTADVQPPVAARRSLQYLATTRSAALVISALGPVLGLMNSFIGVANSNVANLAVVAPGLAEALLVASMGLFTALIATLLHGALKLRLAS